MSIKCPQCGHEFEHFKEYNGWLKPYLPEILDGLKQKKDPKEISQTIKNGQYIPYHGMTQTIRYIAKKYGIEVVDPPSKRERDFVERNEAIFSASKDGGGDASYAALGRIYNLSRDRIRQIVCKEIRKRQHPDEYK